jgi:hypothetical protein
MKSKRSKPKGGPITEMVKKPTDSAVVTAKPGEAVTLPAAYTETPVVVDQATKLEIALKPIIEDCRRLFKLFKEAKFDLGWRIIDLREAYKSHEDVHPTNEQVRDMLGIDDEEMQPNRISQLHLTTSYYPKDIDRSKPFKLYEIGRVLNEKLGFLDPKKKLEKPELVKVISTCNTGPELRAKLMPKKPSAKPKINTLTVKSIGNKVAIKYNGKPYTTGDDWEWITIMMETAKDIIVDALSKTATLHHNTKETLDSLGDKLKSYISTKAILLASHGEGKDKIAKLLERIHPEVQSINTDGLDYIIEEKQHMTARKTKKRKREIKQRWEKSTTSEARYCGDFTIHPVDCRREAKWCRHGVCAGMASIWPMGSASVKCNRWPRNLMDHRRNQHRLLLTDLSRLKPKGRSKQ